MRIPVTMTDMPPVAKVERILRDTWKHLRRTGALSRDNRWRNVRLIVASDESWFVDVNAGGPMPSAWVSAGIIPFEKTPLRYLARALIAECAEKALAAEKQETHNDAA